MRPSPFRDLETIPTRLYRLLCETQLRVSGDRPSFGNWDPPLDIEETDKEYAVTVDLPDMKKEDIKVRVQGDVLTLEGERRLEKKATGKKFHRIERRYGQFLRRFRVPSAIDATAVRADYANGVLKVRLPKSAVSKPTTVDVKVA